MIDFSKTTEDHVHDEAFPQWSSGEGRQVQCSCRLVYFIWDPMDDPDDERDHQAGHGQ